MQKEEHYDDVGEAALSGMCAHLLHGKALAAVEKRARNGVKQLADQRVPEGASVKMMRVVNATLCLGLVGRRACRLRQGGGCCCNARRRDPGCCSALT